MEELYSSLVRQSVWLHVLKGFMSIQKEPSVINVHQAAWIVKAARQIAQNVD